MEVYSGDDGRFCYGFTVLTAIVWFVEVVYSVSQLSVVKPAVYLVLSCAGCKERAPYRYVDRGRYELNTDDMKNDTGEYFPKLLPLCRGV